MATGAPTLARPMALDWPDIDDSMQDSEQVEGVPFDIGRTYRTVLRSLPNAFYRTFETARLLECEDSVDATDETRARLVAWNDAAARVHSDPALRESLLRSVISSMEIEGFTVDRANSERLFEEALDGPPLLFPGDE